MHVTGKAFQCGGDKTHTCQADATLNQPTKDQYSINCKLSLMEQKDIINMFKYYIFSD